MVESTLTALLALQICIHAHHVVVETAPDNNSSISAPDFGEAPDALGASGSSLRQLEPDLKAVFPAQLARFYAGQFNNHHHLSSPSLGELLGDNNHPLDGDSDLRNRFRWDRYLANGFEGASDHRASKRMQQVRSRKGDYKLMSEDEMGVDPEGFERRLRSDMSWPPLGSPRRLLQPRPPQEKRNQYMLLRKGRDTSKEELELVGVADFDKKVSLDTVEEQERISKLQKRSLNRNKKENDSEYLLRFLER